MTVNGVNPSDEERRELSSVLWSYRAAIDRVEMLLEAQIMFSGAGHSHRLSAVADIFDETVLRIGELDLRRELLLCSLAPNPAHESASASLSELIDNFEEPWATVFRDHQTWFQQSVQRIRSLTHESRLMMTSTLDLMEKLVNGSSETVGYDRHGQSLRPAASAVLFDGRV